MRKNSVLLEEPAAAITPEIISKIKKEDMKQAVVEKFSGKAAAKRTQGKIQQQPRDWQPADE